MEIEILKVRFAFSLPMPISFHLSVALGKLETSGCIRTMEVKELCFSEWVVGGQLNPFNSPAVNQ